jgi:prepilin-type N-terminal cleavage/methylation domain-containing protein
MKKGFTLIELLAVIVILAIIALISSPIIVGLIDNVDSLYIIF